MKNKNKNIYVHILRGILIFTAVFALLLSFAYYPELFRSLITMHPHLGGIKIPFTVMFAALIGCFEMVLFFTFRICNEITKDNSFSMANVKNLRAISICAAGMCVILALMFFMLTSVIRAHPALIMLMSVALFACLIVLLLAGTLSKLLSMAKELKDENDLTI